MSQFTPGTPKPESSGRKAGTPNKNTALGRAGVESAIQTCREGGQTPVQIMMQAARFLQTIATLRAGTPASADEWKALAAKPPEELRLLMDMLATAADISAKAATFAYPKLKQVDYVGDVPAANINQDNRVVVMLKIGEGPMPGRRAVAVPVRSSFDAADVLEDDERRELTGGEVTLGKIVPNTEERRRVALRYAVDVLDTIAHCTVDLADAEVHFDALIEASGHAEITVYYCVGWLHAALLTAKRGAWWSLTERGRIALALYRAARTIARRRHAEEKQRHEREQAEYRRH